MDTHSAVLLGLGSPGCTISESLEKLANDVDFGKRIVRRALAHSRYWKDRHNDSLPWRVLNRCTTLTESFTVTVSSGVLTLTVSLEGVAQETIVGLTAGVEFALLDISHDIDDRFDEHTGALLVQALLDTLKSKKKSQFPYAVSRYGQAMVIVNIFQPHEEFEVVFSKGSSTIRLSRECS